MRASLFPLAFTAGHTFVGCQPNTVDDASSHTAARLQTAPTKFVSESLGTPPSVSLQAGLGAVSWGPNRLDVFARASNGDVWQRWFDGTWRDWAPLGFSASSPVAATSWAVGRIDLVYRDPSNNRLHHRYYQNGWFDGGLVGSSTILSGALTAAAWGFGRIDVFQRGASNDLRHIWYANGGWSADWVTEAGTSGDVMSAPSAVAWGANRLDVFWKASSGTLQHWWYDNAVKPLEALGGEGLLSAPTAASRGSGLIDVFYLSSTNTNTLARRVYDRAWLSEDFDLSGASQPAVVSPGPGRLDLFYQDSSNALQHAFVPGPAVLTHHNDNARTGANLHEVELNADNVPTSKFGRLFSINVDGNVYAQPLYVPALDLRAQGRGVRNVVYIATANNSLYMADADDGQILVQKPFNNPVPVPHAHFTPGSQGGVCQYNLLPQVGITSTPVIDLVARRIYLVNVRANIPLSAEPVPATCPGTPISAPATYEVQLHALALETLTEVSGSPVKVTAQSPNGRFTFDSRKQLQRPGLLLSSGAVYLGFGSYTDAAPYTGWVISYDATTLARRNVFVTTPNGDLSTYGMGGIWQAGQGLAADASGNVYFFSGNSPPNRPNQDYAESAVKLSPTLQVLSSFTPWNATFLNDTDLDLGSSGIMLVPGTNYALGGGKESILYLMNRSSLGGYNTNADQVVYEDQVTFGNPACGNTGHSNIHGAPVFWQSPSGPRFYLFGEEDFVRSYALGASSFTPAAKSAVARAGCGMPGGFLSISALNSVQGTGIVWASAPLSDALDAVVPGRVYALNAETLAELWSADIGVNDATERFAKNNPPTIANGKVYVGAFGPASNAAGALNSSYSGKVIVYGLKQK